MGADCDLEDIMTTRVKDRMKNFLKAIEQGNFNEVSKLYRQGVDIHYAEDHPLILACEYGHDHIARFLLENGASIEDSEWEPIKIAIEKNHLTIVELLMEYLPCELSEVFILHAIRYENKSVIKLILNKGYPIDDWEQELYQYFPEEVKQYFTSELLVKKIKEKELEVAQIIIDSGVKITTEVMNASQDLSTLAFLMERKKGWKLSRSRAKVLLNKACTEGNLYVLKELMKVMKVTTEQLKLTLNKGHLDLAKEILNSNIRIDNMSMLNWYPPECSIDFCLDNDLPINRNKIMSDTIATRNMSRFVKLVDINLYDIPFEELIRSKWTNGIIVVIQKTPSLTNEQLDLVIDHLPGLHEKLLEEIYMSPSTDELATVVIRKISEEQQKIIVPKLVCLKCNVTYLDKMNQDLKYETWKQAVLTENWYVLKALIKAGYRNELSFDSVMPIRLQLLLYIDGTNDSCYICFQSTSDTCRLPCGHPFCYDCISVWNKANCPFCQSYLPGHIEDIDEYDNNLPALEDTAVNGSEYANDNWFDITGSEY
jgi:hypothetical protein